MKSGLRVVLDTNVVLSALVFRSQMATAFRQSWQNGRLVPIVSNETVSELIRAMTYPKFRLDAEAQRELLSEYLPFAQVVQIPETMPALPVCRDPRDQAFLELAEIGNAVCLVSGDKDLLEMSGRLRFSIVNPADFLAGRHIEG